MTKEPYQPKTLEKDDNAAILEPDTRMQKKLGNKKLRQIVAPENIEEAAQLSHSEKNAFLEESHEELECAQAIHKTTATEPISDHQFQLIKDIAFSQKSRGGLFGYELASDIANILYKHLENCDFPSQMSRAILGATIEALQGVYHNNITGNGNKIGQEILHDLNILAERNSE